MKRLTRNQKIGLILLGTVAEFYGWFWLVSNGMITFGNPHCN